MVKKELLGKLIDPKIASILRIVLRTQEELTLQEISQKSLVSPASTYRILQDLAAMEILNRREWKNSKVYKPHENEKVEFLRTLFDEEVDAVAEFSQAAQSIPGVQSIILYGSAKKGKANILLIGESINATSLEPLKNTLKDRGADISYLALTKEQYDRMVTMGLYSGEKKILK